jgi:hypothetical protein
MSVVRANNNVIEVTAYEGDAKTLLAFDLVADSARTGLAGFTIQVHPPGSDPYFVDNNLRLADPSKHAQVAGETAFSSANAPIHKFRWVHVPGLVHQGGTPAIGTYTYVVTPRYFTAGVLQPLDPSTSVSVNVDVGPFVKGPLRLAFTRGYVQSQAFVRHFGPSAHIRPAGDELIFDTAATAATNAAGQSFSYAQEYAWMGFTAREQVFDVLREVDADPSLRLAVFAYDLNEPDVCALLLKLAKTNPVRIILDNATLHHNAAKPTPEDQFEAAFKAQAGADSAIKRGRFGRYAHDKVFIVSDQQGPRSVLTGSTNFSVTGLYVNANHVLVFEDRQVAGTYADVFAEAWNTDVKAAPFAASQWAAGPFTFGGNGQALPSTAITFSPHSAEVAQTILTGLVDRITSEGTTTGTPVGTVFFAVMELNGTSTNPVYTALNAVHSDPNTFSFGISDAPAGVSLYPVGAKTGVLVTGKPGTTTLPPPFDQVPTIAGHEIHHKFVVCGFNGADPVVYCGSSNLALGGEQANGDNLLAIHDADVATAFTIEALLLVDHYNFLDSLGKNAAVTGTPAGPPQADRQAAAEAAGWFLGTTDQWADKYFDPNDLHSVDRRLFGDGPAVPATATASGAGRSGPA